MGWRHDRWKPSREEYKKFEKDLAKKTSSIESGLKVFFAMLFLMPTSVLLFACAVGIFGAQVRGFAQSILLLGATGFLMPQAYRGIVKREVRVLPRSRIQNETTYVGGKMSAIVRGRVAFAVGIVFLALGVGSLTLAIRVLLTLL
jgi:hypothetical protein